MQDRLFIVHPTPADEYYKPQPEPPGGWPKRTEPTVEQLNRAHQNIRQLVLEKDRIIQQGNALCEELKRERRWRRWLTAAFAATWVSIYCVLKYLIPYAIKGMLR